IRSRAILWRRRSLSKALRYGVDPVFEEEADDPDGDHRKYELQHVGLLGVEAARKEPLLNIKTAEKCIEEMSKQKTLIRNTQKKYYEEK
uniref:hypothetical protein n=1 Tax=Phascolarctobacterium faecium TaxID=33025 RepID=UPI003AB15CB0